MAPSPSVAPPTGGPTPSLAGGLTSEGWRPVPEQPAIREAQLFDVAWTGSRFVAVGGSGDGASFLESADGVTWTSTPVETREAYPRTLAAGAGSVVAIGSAGNRDASWARLDGGSWSSGLAVFPGSAASGQRLEVMDVAPTAGGWVAVGRVVVDCRLPCGEPPVRAVAWKSPDGLDWAEVPQGDTLEGAGMSAVTALEDQLVAIGQRGRGAAFWTSRDGVDWQRVPDDPAFGPPPGSLDGAYVDSLAIGAGHGVLVAAGIAIGAGEGGAPIILAWRSTNGREWTRSTVELPEPGQVFSVAATEERFLATGPSGGESCRGGIWASNDGAAWTCVAGEAPFEGLRPYAAAGSPFAEIVVGLTSAGWDEEGGEALPGAVWWRPIP